MELFDAMEDRVHYTTTVKRNLLKRLKVLAIEVGKRQNDLLEEAIQDLLKKYAGKPPRQS